MKIKIFTVFHHRIDQRLIFNQFTTRDVERVFVIYAVNPNYRAKQVVQLDGRKVTPSSLSNAVLEYELPWYDASLQEKGFMEASCFVHVLKNNLHIGWDYIGLCQYDMRWTRSATNVVRLVESGKIFHDSVWGMTCGRIMKPDGGLHPLAFANHRNWPYLVHSYNQFFGTRWGISILIDKPLTLWQTYILPQKEFVAMASWIVSFCTEVYPWACEPPYETHWGVLGGYVERAEAVFIAARLAEGKIRCQNLCLDHDPFIVEKLGITKGHYSKVVR